ncbi:hypothetical protein SAXI111661_18170 [Saccharomonospora xinjiangensis]
MHRVPHVLGDVQAGVDQPLRGGVRVVQQRRNPPWPGLSPHLRGPVALAGRLGAEPEGTAAAESGRPVAQASHDLQQPEAAEHQGLLRTLDLRLRHPHRRPRPGRRPRREAAIPDQRQGNGDHLVGELGRRSRRRARARTRRPARGETLREGQVRVRAHVHVLPAPDLRALPQPVVCGVVSLRRDLQAHRGRHRARRSGPLPGLAHVRHRLPLQEGVLQPPHRQGREVHLLLPPRGGRAAHGVRGDVRGTAALHRSRPLRRRSGHRGRVRAGTGAAARATGTSARPERP